MGQYTVYTSRFNRYENSCPTSTWYLGVGVRDVVGLNRIRYWTKSESKEQTFYSSNLIRFQLRTVRKEKGPQNTFLICLCCLNEEAVVINDLW